MSSRNEGAFRLLRIRVPGLVMAEMANIALDASRTRSLLFNRGWSRVNLGSCKPGQYPPQPSTQEVGTDLTYEIASHMLEVPENTNISQVFCEAQQQRTNARARTYTTCARTNTEKGLGAHSP